MNKIIFTLFSFVFLFSFISAENINGTEWWVLNITNETVDENNVTWGNVSNYTTNPKIDNVPQFEVLATMESTFWWAEVQLNTTEINFGDVKKENAYIQRYRIKARGTVDIKVTPVLKNTNDNFFSNLKFSNKNSSYKSIGSYFINFTNLSKKDKDWCVLLSDGTLKKENETTSKGEQYIKLDLTNFEGIIPFDIPMQNTVVFQITPLWSSVEPISEEKVYREYVDL